MIKYRKRGAEPRLSEKFPPFYESLWLNAIITKTRNTDGDMFQGYGFFDKILNNFHEL